MAPKLQNAPIIEAVLDVDCDLSPGFDLTSHEERSRAIFGDVYPSFNTQIIQEHRMVAAAEPPNVSFAGSGPVLQSFLFRSIDGKQIVQVRAQGFSFNRLAPYTSLDDYLSEIERTWRLYVELVSPIQIRAIRLRYINRILLPMTGDNAVDLDEFLKIGPRLPDEERLIMSGFLNQQSAVERDSGLQVNLVLTSQPGVNEELPIILDITVASTAIITEPLDWAKMRPTIDALRTLKNRIFENSLSPKCLRLFQ